MKKLIIKHKVLLLMLLVVVLGVLLFFGTEMRPQWGEGELPTEWKAYFGDDNGSRLDSVQNDMINRHEILIFGQNKTTEDGQKAHEVGIIDYLRSLDDRIKALEVPEE